MGTQVTQGWLYQLVRGIWMWHKTPELDPSLLASELGLLLPILLISAQISFPGERELSNPSASLFPYTHTCWVWSSHKIIYTSYTPKFSFVTDTYHNMFTCEDIVSLFSHSLDNKPHEDRDHGPISLTTVIPAHGHHLTFNRAQKSID